MSSLRTILIKENVINSTGAIIIPKGKLLKLDLATIDRLKSHRIYFEIMNSENYSPHSEQIRGNFSQENLLREHMLSDNNNNHSLQFLKNNNAEEYITILDIMNNFLFESKNEEWYLYLSTLSNGYSWHYSHSINVAVISAIIGLNLGYKEEQLHTLILGSLLHDIGIILLPKNILLKDKNSITPEEKTIYEKHTSLGYEMIKNLSISEECKKIVLYHHVLLNGEGYPDLYEDDKLDIETQIAIVADYFDSEAREEKTPEEIITYLVNNPDKFPIEIVATLKNALKI